MHSLDNNFTEDVLALLMNTYLFNVFTRDELNAIIALCEEVTVPSECILFEEGDRPDCFYIIVQGSVSVYQSIPGKGAVELTQLGQGDFFGEMSLLDGFPRSATAKTLEACRLLALSFEAFNELMSQNRDVGIKWLWTFCRILSSRLRDTNENYKKHLSRF